MRLELRKEVLAVTASRPVTLADVARVAGVSTSTTSRVLNGGANVSASLRLRVLAVADALGYVSNMAAQALRGRRRAVFTLVPDARTFPIAAQAASIEEAARAEGVLASVVMIGRDTTARVSRIQALRTLKPHAIIVSYTEPEVATVGAELQRFVDEGGHVVTMGEPKTGFPRVCHDDQTTVRLLGEHLLGLGRRRPAIVTDHGALRHRQEAMLACFADHGIDPATVPVVTVERDSIQASQATRRFITASDSCDLIYATNDVLALGVMDALTEMGVRIPEDIAVAGHDDIPLSRDATPGLTTVALDFAAAGRAALAMALDDDPPAITCLAGRLVIRGSTAGAG
ncbi:MAG: LacI family transcriptional regulator [Propionibacteriaceae bacterium]|nr:LacI family transcriptional regulator [Propionibacteriaceae bacterium]